MNIALRQVQAQKAEKAENKEKRAAERKEKKEQKAEATAAKAQAKEHKQREKKEAKERKQKEQQEKREKKASTRGRGRGRGRGAGAERGGRGRRKRARAEPARVPDSELHGEGAEAGEPGNNAEEKGAKMADAQVEKPHPAPGSLVARGRKRKRSSLEDSGDDSDGTGESGGESDESADTDGSGSDEQSDSDEEETETESEKAQRRQRQREMKEESLVIERGQFLVIKLAQDSVNSRPFGLGRVLREANVKGLLSVQPFLPVDTGKLFDGYRACDDGPQDVSALSVVWQVDADDMDQDDKAADVLYLPESVCASLKKEYRL